MPIEENDKSAIIAEFNSLLKRLGFSYEDTSFYLSPADLAAWRDYHSATVESAKGLGFELFDGIDDLHSDSYLEILTKHAGTALAQHGKEHMLSEVLLTRFPTADFNASAVRFPSGYAVLLNAGLFDILSKFTRIFIALGHVVKVDYDTSEASVAEADRLRAAELTVSLVATIMLFVGRPMADLASKSSVDAATNYAEFSFEEMMIRSQFLVGMELFVLFHELAHVDAGHIPFGSSLNAINTELKLALAKSHDQEFEADAGAFQFLISFIGSEDASNYFEITKFIVEKDYQATEDELRNEFGVEKLKSIAASAEWNPELIFSSVPMFFFLADLVDYAFGELHPGAISTHPHPAERSQKFIAAFREAYDYNNRDLPRGLQNTLSLLAYMNDKTKIVISSVLKMQIEAEAASLGD